MVRVGTGLRVGLLLLVVLLLLGGEGACGASGQSARMLWTRAVPRVPGGDSRLSFSSVVTSRFAYDGAGKSVVVAIADNTQTDGDKRLQIVQLGADQGNIVASYTLNRTVALNATYDPVTFFPEITDVFFGGNSSVLFVAASGGPFARDLAWLWRADLEKKELLWERAFFRGSSMNARTSYIPGSSSEPARILMAMAATFDTEGGFLHEAYTLELDPADGSKVRDARVNLPDAGGGTLSATGVATRDNRFYFAVLNSDETETTLGVNFLGEQRSQVWKMSTNLTDVFPPALSASRPLVGGIISLIAHSGASATVRLLSSAVYLDQQSESFESIVRQSLVELNASTGRLLQTFHEPLGTNRSILRSFKELDGALVLSMTSSSGDNVCNHPLLPDQNLVALSTVSLQYEPEKNVDAQIFFEGQSVYRTKMAGADNGSLLVLLGHSGTPPSEFNFTMVKFQRSNKKPTRADAEGKKISCVRIDRDGAVEETLVMADPGGENMGEKKEKRACFPASAKVEVENEGPKAMEQLEHGSSVHVGGGKFSKIFCYSHRITGSDDYFDFLRLTTKTPGGLRPSLTVTEGHYIYVAGRGLVTAESVRVGDLLRRGDGTTAEVVRIERNVKAKGLFNPHTMHGDIVVDGFLVSTYTSAVPPALAHRLLAPVRWSYRLFGQDSTLLKTVERLLNQDI